MNVAKPKQKIVLHECPHCGQHRHRNHIGSCPKNPDRKLRGIAKFLNEGAYKKADEPEPTPAPASEPAPEPKPAPKPAPEPQRSQAEQLKDRLTNKNPTKEREPEPRQSTDAEEATNPADASRQEESTGPAQAPGSSPQGRPVNLRKYLTWISIAAGAILVVLLVYWLFSRKEEKPPTDPEITKQNSVWDAEQGRLVPGRPNWREHGFKDLPSLG